MRRFLADMLGRIPDAWLARAEAASGFVCKHFFTGFLWGAGFAAGALAVLLFTLVAARAESIPANALRHRAELTRCGRYAFGLAAPVATLAAQVHQESRWRENAVSPVGARGLAQFMPSTSKWIAGLVPGLAANDPFNPGWALRALATYDKWLWDRVTAQDGCQRMAMALSGYNGGLGWVRRDKALAGRNGVDPLIWFDHVERFNAGRAAAAWKENRGYPRRILGTLEPLYIRAGWGQGVCHVTAAQ
ncbi:Lytic transglycosylase catalytic [Solidesulfovibrio fructosivorans JJ]]|uniref:Lytic transglycosylase catalytic n=1 Tax=Solidesulfovibrio fructosivorans JJ] TaxID=596151 RepID=E1JU89_SOLFR|nr:Lytic transglycosylase catalytic [Solidesulfovibrio fructosivorans JJ]]